MASDLAEGPGYCKKLSPLWCIPSHSGVCGEKPAFTSKEGWIREPTGRCCLCWTSSSAAECEENMEEFIWRQGKVSLPPASCISCTAKCICKFKESAKAIGIIMVVTPIHAVGLFLSLLIILSQPVPTELVFSRSPENIPQHRGSQIHSFQPSFDNADGSDFELLRGGLQ